MKHYTIEATGFADDIWATCGDRRIQMQPHQQFVLAEEAAAALAEERAKRIDIQEKWHRDGQALIKASRVRDALAQRVAELESQLSGLYG